MKKAILTAGLVLAQTFAVSAFAQGEVGGVKKAPTPSTMSATEKAEARSDRKADAAAANQAGMATKGGLVGGVKPAPDASTAMSGKDKAAARSERRSDAAAANAAGNATKGGLVGPTK